MRGSQEFAAMLRATAQLPGQALWQVRKLEMLHTGCESQSAYAWLAHAPNSTQFVHSSSGAMNLPGS